MRGFVLATAGILIALILAGCTYERTALTPEPTEAAPEGATPESTPDHTPAPEVTPEATPETEPEPTPAPAPTPTSEPDLADEFSDEPWMDRGRLTVLLAGSDAGFDRHGTRTDSMIVASVDLDTGYTTLFGIPRAFGDVPLPDQVTEITGMTHYPGQINWLYSVAEDFEHIAGEGQDPGLVALKGALSELLNIPIDYYAMVDMEGFVRLVDAFGGVGLDVQHPVHVRIMSPVEGEGWQTFEINPGEQTLDGREALAYSRSRSGTSDYDRMERQRCVVAAVTEQADLATVLQIFPDLVDVIVDTVVTDIPIEQLPDIVMLRDEIRSDRIVSVGLTPPEYSAGTSSEGHILPAVDDIQNTVHHVLAEPDAFLDDGQPGIVDDRHC
jgi:polyisoprenyl-teichoic acid--peptidoglycan teichoic acid transferase